MGAVAMAQGALGIPFAVRGLLLGCTLVAAAHFMHDTGFSPTPLTAEYDLLSLHNTTRTRTIHTTHTMHDTRHTTCDTTRPTTRHDTMQVTHARTRTRARARTHDMRHPTPEDQRHQRHDQRHDTRHDTTHMPRQHFLTRVVWVGVTLVSMWARWSRSAARAPATGGRTRPCA
jgi:hypothetical protein